MTRLDKGKRKMIFKVQFIWDEDAEVFYTESDIKGLNLEDTSLERLQEATEEIAPELIMRNHISADDLQSFDIKDLIPSIHYHPCQHPKLSSH